MPAGAAASESETFPVRSPREVKISICSLVSDLEFEEAGCDHPRRVRCDTRGRNGAAQGAYQIPSFLNANLQFAEIQSNDSSRSRRRDPDPISGPDSQCLLGDVGLLV